MDSFTEDLSSPLPKQALQENQWRGPSALEESSELPSTTSRPAAVVLRPLSRTVVVKQRAAGGFGVRGTSLEIVTISEEDSFQRLSDDILEYVLAHLPLFPLKAAKKVSKRWASIIGTPEFDVLQKELGEQQPLLVCYGINHLVRSKSRGFAFDVELEAWVPLPSLQFPAHNSGTLAGGSGVVYAIAGPGEDRLWYKLTSAPCSMESFGETWYETPVMRYPRSAPVVSVALGSGIAHKLVVAGGVPEFEDNHMAVELFDSETGAWEYCGELPEEFAEYNTRTWMSGAVCNNKFYTSLLHSGSLHVLDLHTKQWNPKIQLELPEGLISHHVMAIGTTLVVAGLLLCAAEEENNNNNNSEQHTDLSVNLWKVDVKTGSLLHMGVMPSHLLFKSSSSATTTVPSVKFLMNENLLFVSLEDGEVVVVGEVCVEEGKTRWRKLPSLGCRFDSAVMFCTSICDISSSPQKS